jgi:hypothetical protein
MAVVEWQHNLNTDTVSRRNPGTGHLEVLLGIEDPDNGEYSGWYALADIDDGAEVPELVALTLRAGNHPYHRLAEHAGADLGGLETAECPPLTARLLRAVPLGLLRSVVNLHLATRREVRGRLPDPTRAKRHDDQYYASWAGHYARAAESSPRPIVELADKFGMDRGQVRDVIHACRRRGFLTPATRGIAGGQLTDQALDALGRKADNG